MARYIDEYRNSDLARQMAGILSSYKGRPVKLMEVCGTHTMSIFKYGIRDILPENIRLVSGPGCPVCVTPVNYIDHAVRLSRMDNVVITTFGDLMRVPGSESSLLKEKAQGRDIRMVYSPLDAVKLAADNPDKKVVFLSIGFETTTPVIAVSVLRAFSEGIKNFYVLAANKTMPEALKLLALDRDVNIDGYLYPGHVSAITGISGYEEMAKTYKIPGVVTGFEPLDILHAIITLVTNINDGKYVVENQYSRVVRNHGNPVALEKMNEVFEPVDAIWRGMGTIPGSGLKLRDKYAAHDAWREFGMPAQEYREPKGCLCGEILKGRKIPKECGLFGVTCTPENPVGACMVSSEGTCAAYYKYNV
ncbi:MAG: hydrogenase formation protein HypD [Clostridiales bacterium]|jgi:hydrogenase expression/formation protein HypD|nr:hydrogenase formation protein HypD [Eubacteriales bacterium]MDH7564916.1 hydrogenase formation protein HypD [Clostridiales bacterium]